MCKSKSYEKVLGLGAWNGLSSLVALFPKEGGEEGG